MTEKNHLAATWLGLENRVCVVTGGGSGIGAETARQLAAAGAAVAVLDRDDEGAAEVAEHIVRAGGRALCIAADVTCAEAVAEAASRLEREFGACQVLVNNAGVLDGGALMAMDMDKWNQLMSVNLTGSLRCIQAFGGQMIAAKCGGSIVNVASIAGHYPLPYGGAYSVSKAGVMMLSRLLTVELAQHGIRSNVVSPALVRTPLSEFSYRDPAVARQRAQMVPAGRVCDPAELAATILFLASDRASYINGQEILVDGGLSQTWMSLIPRPGYEQLGVPGAG
jgi:NAD(P)-dependent dehydrogenase (short-subunit alcohol dehydrogenase family)